MAVPQILTSIRGRLLGLDPKGRLIAGGLNRGVQRSVVFVAAAASTAITNTVTETAFSHSYTIPANSFAVEQVFWIEWQGIATSTNGTDTLTIKVYFGGLSGTLLFTHAATDVADNNVFSGAYKVTVRTIAGTSMVIVGNGSGKSVPAAEGTATYKDDILAATTVDPTVAKAITISAQWSVASASNSCRLDVMTVETA